MRISCGCIWPSNWLLTFSGFFFLSLALLKRYSELVIMQRISGDSARARGYEIGDAELLASKGTASGYVAMLVLALYISSGPAASLYGRHRAYVVPLPITALLDRPCMAGCASRQDERRSSRIRDNRLDQPDPDPAYARRNGVGAMKHAQVLTMRAVSTQGVSAKSCPAIPCIIIAGLALISMLSLPLLVTPTFKFEMMSSPGAEIEQKSTSGTDQAAGHQEDTRKTIMELQQFRLSSSIHLRAGDGRGGVATLVNLHPAIGAWYLLKVAWDGSPESNYHLENPAPLSRKLILDEKFPAGVVIIEGESRHPCNLFASSSDNALTQARASQNIYAPLCDGQIYLRNPAKGQRTQLEAATEFLRTQVGAERK